MDVLIQPVTNWWHSFCLLITNFFTTMGPREYSYLLIITGIVGYFFLKGGSR